MPECIKCGEYTKYNKGLCSVCYNKDREGESFIAEYFDSLNIKYEREFVINHLRNDNKSHRRVDFFLPKYKMNVEFFGGWNNSKEERERYREKKNVYYENNIPCIYLYPENLGIIEFSFQKRMIKELKRHKLHKELFRFRSRLLINDRGILFIWLILSLVLLPIVAFNSKENDALVYILAGIAGYQLFRLGMGYIYFFKTY